MNESNSNWQGNQILIVSLFKFLQLGNVIAMKGITFSRCARVRRVQVGVIHYNSLLEFLGGQESGFKSV